MDAYDSGSGGQVIIEVYVDEVDDPLTMTFPVEVVEPADAA